MKIAIGSDHGGFLRKKEIAALLGKLGHKVVDVGCHSEDSCDYPDYARKVGQSVANGQAERGILVCGTGIGMSIAANKVPGIRAAVAWNKATAGLASEHNNANVLCVSGRFLKPAVVAAMIKAWLTTPFGGGRHLRRVKKISKLEQACCPES